MACLRMSGRVPDGEIMPMAQRAFLARLSVRARRFAKSAAGAGEQAKSLFTISRARARQGVAAKEWSGHTVHEHVEAGFNALYLSIPPARSRS
ncbi:hypothetical protein B0T39_18670 [Chromobacterium haemolyticum]|nr:hypothetical protein B0T39_18670 [Chromobacterium haemolyticum]